MLEILDLHVSYGHVQAVRGFAATVRPGRITLVLGSNGAGKTTSLRTISGLQPSVRGSVRLDGQEVLGQATHRLVSQGVTLVPEGRKIFSSLTVEENLRVGGFLSPNSSTADRIEQIYETFPVLRERRRGAAGLLSGGEQQMLAFGRALMSGPKVILLDEPSMGLAPVVVDQVLAEVRRIADSGIGVLMVEQNAEAALEVADDIVVMARGEVVHAGPADAASSHSSVLRAFLGEEALG